MGCKNFAPQQRYLFAGTSLIQYALWAGHHTNYR
jgi:hypothetical protein